MGLHLLGAAVRVSGMTRAVPAGQAGAMLCDPAIEIVDRTDRQVDEPDRNGRQEVDDRQAPGRSILDQGEPQRIVTFRDPLDGEAQIHRGRPSIHDHPRDPASVGGIG